MSLRTRHLEFLEGREVVYCHSCSNEWYREGGQGLLCPRCASEITEIIDPQNDPRLDDLPPLVGPGSPGMPHSPLHHFDSDPEEEDIEDHMRHGPGGSSASFRSNRTPPRSSDEPYRPDQNEVLARFAEMISTDFGLPHLPGHLSPSIFSSGPGFHTRTFARTSPMGATTTFTIATGPVRGGPGGPDFNSMFPDFLRDVEIPGHGHAREHHGGNDFVGGGVFGASLRDFLQVFMNPSAAVHGDAVFTQEALDEIITRLMEQNPLSNAAPPASEDAINRMERKKADEQLLGQDGKAECTICIDEIKLGDEVMALPCKHWFHPDCVTLWLKEHNTCPICRTPIESGRNAGGSSGQAQQQPRQRPTASQHPSGFASYPPSPHRNRPERFANQRENEDRLQSIRNLAELRNPSNQSSASGGNRRGSLSPIQRTYSTSELASRTRVRSPSNSRDLDRGYVTAGGGGSSSDRPREGSGAGGGGGSGSMSGTSNHNPMSWLRNTFTRNRENPSADRKSS